MLQGEALQREASKFPLLLIHVIAAEDMKLIDAQAGVYHVT